MGTKTIIYVLFFDIVLALMVGAYSGLTPPSIPSMPSQYIAQSIADSFVWTVGIPQITLIPSFSILGATFPGLSIPAVTFFSISFSWLWPVIYVFLLLAWIFSVLGSVIGYLFSIFTSSVLLLVSVPAIGPFLSAFVLIINFILIWEIIKLIRGYGP